MQEISKTVLPPAPEIITARPDGMDYKKYKELRTLSNKKLKARHRGFLVHLSQELLLDQKTGKPIGYMFRRGKTFVGDTSSLQLV